MPRIQYINKIQSFKNLNNEDNVMQTKIKDKRSNTMQKKLCIEYIAYNTNHIKICIL